MNAALSELLAGLGLSNVFAPTANEDAYLGEIPAGQVTGAWVKLAGGFRQTGYWPIIRGDEPEPGLLDPQQRDSILANAPSGGIRELLAARALERLGTFEELAAELPEKAVAWLSGISDPPDLDQFAAAVDASGALSFGGGAPDEIAWPAAPDPKKQRVRFNTLQRRKGRASLIWLVRMRQPFESPAFFGFGGWNECPAPELHVAVLREWFVQYKAVPAVITNDVIECAVTRRPQTQEQCMRLAAEQWIYCDDIVAQGTQSVRKLAIELWESPNWFFWWD